MMTSDIAKALTTVSMLLPQSVAAGEAAASNGIDVSAYEGALVFIEEVGMIGGTLAGKIITSHNANLSDPVDVASFTARTTANDNSAALMVVPCSAVRKYVGYSGTVAVGAALLGVTVLGTPKYT
jgi:hypothetical protein